MNLVELCRRLTAIDSSTSTGTLAIVEFAAALARQWGLEAVVQEDNSGGVANANVFLRPKQHVFKPEDRNSGHELALISRLDTTNPDEYGLWARTGANPFQVSVDGDSLYGLGLADAKADFACKLLALKETADRSYQKISPVIVGSFGLGSGAGAIRMIRKKSLRPKGVLVGAPTGLALANRGPGYAKVEISVPFSSEERDYHDRHNLVEGSVSQSKLFTRADSATASDLFAGNPVVRLLDYLKNLPSGMAVISIDGGASAESEPDSALLEIDVVDGLKEGMIERLRHIGAAMQQLDLELKTTHAEGCLPSFSTMTLGMIRTFPEEVKISGVCRLVPAGGRDLYKTWFEKLRQNCAATGATFHLVDYKPPFETSTDGAFFTFLKGVSSTFGFSGQLQAAPACTEANVFQRLGVESLVFGPGTALAREHASEEHVNILELEKAKQFYVKTIASYCQ